MDSRTLRKLFFDYFVANQHERVGSSSLIPAQDPTLLFANAGMNQFKDLFLGLEQRTYKRAVTIQKCVRAGGKHNDLDNVGFTKRHLTFFEMMGNFSFGDYFKKEAIQFAWEFLTKHIQLPVEKLHATVYETDDESYDIWHHTIGLPKEKIHRLGAATNFWQMGDVGPCGPCTEIFIDRGLDYGQATDTPATDSERFLEIWNLVFMQFDRQPDGNLKPLKKTGVDTGMGLERLALVVQQKDSVFQTDLFTPLIAATEQLSGIIYQDQPAITKAAFHVLADHSRCASLLIADGCAPSNEGRGYVLRKIIRRAALFSQKLGSHTIFANLSKVVVQELGDIYPDLATNAQLIYNILQSETEKFSANLQRGMHLLETIFAQQKSDLRITGQQAFKLYDTYGFPVELLIAAGKERGYEVDTESFEQHMQQQKLQSGTKTTDTLNTLELTESTEFTGYQELETTSQISALVCENQLVNSVGAGSECFVITKKSPFFIVGGGQVPDQGWILIDGNQIPILEVRFIHHAIAARIIAPTDLHVGQSVTSIVDSQWRTNAMKNHTATHLLQSALITLFGKQIKQSGSLVHPDYLRFDFTYHENLNPAQLKQVEDLVNEKIRQNILVTITYCTLKEATTKGALAFFGDKYKPEKVRMVEVDNFSTELCGGTHVTATGDIGVFKIVDVSALSAGHRRITAVTGKGALQLFQDYASIIKELCTEYKVKPQQIIDVIARQKESIKEAQQINKELKQQLIKHQVPAWLAGIKQIGDIPFLFVKVDNMNITELQEIAHQLSARQEGFYFVATTQNNQPLFFALSSGKIGNSLNLKAFADWLRNTHQLKGGVQKNSLQGGGATLPASLQQDIIHWIQQHTLP